MCSLLFIKRTRYEKENKEYVDSRDFCGLCLDGFCRLRAFGKSV